jgi:energy-coupling factor transporter ATP-binding protein EcfA2
MSTAAAWLPDIHEADPEVVGRPVFKHIRDAAHSEGCSGDVLFYSSLARLSGMISHHYRAVTGIGGRASLNIFSAIVGNSGAGKSTGSSLTRTLMPAPDDEFRDGLPVGSGEGIAEAFMGTVEEPTGEVVQRGKNVGDPVMRRVRKQVRHNAYFYVDEGQTIAKLGERNGSVLGETLRRAAVGETLGQTNASEERTRYIPAGSYSLGLLVGFQPSTAVPVLADASTGTPQRFLWGWADDPAIPDSPPAWPGPLEAHPGTRRPDGPVDIKFPERIRRMLWTEKIARNRGEIEVPELDGHAGLIKVKVAAMLALLDNREYVTEEDWALAEIVWASSCGARDHLVERAQREAAAEREREETAKVLQVVREHEAKAEASVAVERVARLVRKHASQVGGITWGELNRRMASRDRKVLRKAVDLAEARDWVFSEGDRVCVKTD